MFPPSFDLAADLKGYGWLVNSGRLISFLMRLVYDSGRKVFLIFDNLRVHHSKRVKKWLEGRENEIRIHQ